MPETNASVCNLGAYLKAVADLRRGWNLRPDDEIWFRGESDDFGARKLKPTIYRPVNYVSGPERHPSRIKDVEAILKQEYLLFCNFQHGAAQFQECRSCAQDEDWDDYFLMQHHGGPTRLLDWTDQPLIALYFALRDAIRDCRPRVFVLEPDRMITHLSEPAAEAQHKENWLRYLEKNKHILRGGDEWEEIYLPMHQSDREQLPMPLQPLLLDFDHSSRRINAQGSRLILYGMSTDALVNQLHREASYRAIDEIVIEQDSVPSIADELAGIGVTAASAFPDLDGVGRSVADKWRRWATSDY